MRPTPGHSLLPLHVLLPCAAQTAQSRSLSPAVNGNTDRHDELKSNAGTKDERAAYSRNFNVDDVTKARESCPQLLLGHPTTQATNEEGGVGGIEICGKCKQEKVSSTAQSKQVNKGKRKSPPPDGCGACTALAVVELAFFLAVAKLTRIGRLDKKWPFISVKALSRSASALQTQHEPTIRAPGPRKSCCSPPT